MGHDILSSFKELRPEVNFDYVIPIVSSTSPSAELV